MMPMVRVLVLLGAFFSAPAFAQQDAAEARSTAFEAVQGARPEDNVPGGKLVISAYGVVLVLLVGYVLRLGLLQRKTSADVERLSSALKRTPSKS